MHVLSTNKKVFVIHVRVETSFVKIKRITKKVFLTKDFFLLSHPLFPMILYLGAIKCTKYPNQLQTHISVIKIYRILHKSSKYITIL